MRENIRGQSRPVSFLNPHIFTSHFIMEAETETRARRPQFRGPELSPETEAMVRRNLEDPQNCDFQFLTHVLNSLTEPETLGINEFLYALAFDLAGCPNEGALMAIRETSSMPSFPVDAFADEAHVNHLVAILQHGPPPIVVAAARNVLATVFESDAAYEHISAMDVIRVVKLVAVEQSLVSVVAAMALHLRQLPPETYGPLREVAMAMIADEREEIMNFGLLMACAFKENDVAFDMSLVMPILQEKFGASPVGPLPLTVLALLSDVSDPPVVLLPGILEVLRGETNEARAAALHVLRKFALQWPDEAKPEIAASVMAVLYDVPFADSLKALDLVMATCQPLPRGDLQLFSKFVEVIGIWDTASALLGIIEMIDTAPSDDVRLEMAQILAMNQSAVEELLTSDDDAYRTLASRLLEVCECVK